MPKLIAQRPAIGSWTWSRDCVYWCCLASPMGPADGHPPTILCTVYRRAALAKQKKMMVIEPLCATKRAAPRPWQQPGKLCRKLLSSSLLASQQTLLVATEILIGGKLGSLFFLALYLWAYADINVAKKHMLRFFAINLN